MQVPTVRDTLRMRTADVHARLERVPTLQRLLAREATIEEYARLLQAYRAFYLHAHASLQLGLHTLYTHGLDVAERDVLHRLDRDLTTLGIEPFNGETALNPASPAEAVGWLWVSEGSALGAQIIDRALDALFGDRREGRRFFETVPDQGLRWRAVCASMEHYGRLQDTLEPLVNGALVAFDCIERSFMRMQR